MPPYVVGSVDGAKTNRMGGVAGSLDQLDGKNRMAAFMPLNEATGIRRAQFDTDAMLLTTNSMVIPISDKVECYNKTTGDWFKPGEDGDHKAALNLALAFSDDITVYYDRSSRGGRQGPHRRCGMSFVLPKVYQKRLESFGFQGVFTFPAPVLSTKRLP